MAKSNSIRENLVILPKTSVKDVLFYFGGDIQVDLIENFQLNSHSIRIGPNECRCQEKIVDFLDGIYKRQVKFFQNDFLNLLSSLFDLMK